MYYFFPNEDGRVLSVETGAKPGGATSAEALPPMPDLPENEQPALYYIDGVLAWKSEPKSPPKPEQGPTKDEQEAKRAEAYRERVDPITCEIQRLRDMGGTEAEIAEAEERRAKAVQSVKEEYPYPQEAQ